MGKTTGKLHGLKSKSITENFFQIQIKIKLWKVISNQNHFQTDSKSLNKNRWCHGTNVLWNLLENFKLVIVRTARNSLQVEHIPV
jgi:hypothetical protein